MERSSPGMRRVLSLFLSIGICVALLPVHAATAVDAPRRLSLLAPSSIAGIQFVGMSTDGGHVIVQSSEDLLTGVGSQPGTWDHAGNRFVPLVRALVSVEHVTPDGRTMAVFTGSRLTPDDTDLQFDIFVISGTTTRLVSIGTALATDFVAHLAVDGSSAVFESREALTADDVDATDDFYRWDAATGALTLLTIGMTDPSFVFSNDDETHVLFKEHLSDSIVERVGDTMVERARDTIVGASSDGRRIYFRTRASMSPDDADDNVFDAYAWDDGGFHLLTGGIDEDVSLLDVSADDSRLLLSSGFPLTAGDVDDGNDLYVLEGTDLELLTPGTTDVGSAWADAEIRSVVYEADAATDPPEDVSFDLYRWDADAPGTAERITHA
jgi:hypothetical protein